MEKALFKLETFKFTKASLDFNIPASVELNVDFKPKGVFYPKDARYELYFDTIIKCDEIEVITVSCDAMFKFNDISNMNDIPEYFYPNSLAILFPYVRAFVSNISLQANVQPIMLPTINLSGIKEELRENTKVED